MPTLVKSAENMQVEAEMRRFGVPIPIDGVTALRQELARSNGIVWWLHWRLEQMDPATFGWGIEREEWGEGTSNKGGDTHQITHAARDSWEWRTFEKERRHLHDLTKTAISANLAEREIKIHEEQGKLLARVIYGLIDAPELALNDGQRESARGVAFKLLKELPAAAT